MRAILSSDSTVQRGQGLASACMRVLCRRLLENRDAVCLFYDNPAAGRIYKRLGFRDIGFWAMAQRQQA